MPHTYCNNPLTPSTAPCQFFASACPLHDDLATPQRPEPAAAPEPSRRKERVDVRTLARDALEAVGANMASPTLTTRFVNALRATEAMGEEPETLQEQAQMAAMLGGIMHGIPPRDREQWEMLEEMHDNQTMMDLYRWYPYTWFDDIRLDKVLEPVVHSRSEAWELLLDERKEWGLKHPGWEEDDVLSDPPPWRVRIRSRHDHRRAPETGSRGWGNDPQTPHEPEQQDSDARDW